MADDQLWRKSKKSNGGTSCVEVFHTLLAVRDSKNPTGPVLNLAGLTESMSQIKSGRFD
jgi:hypothetical protein